MVLWIGIAGGYFVATAIKGLAPSTYLDSIQMFSTISDFTLGLLSPVYLVLYCIGRGL